MACLLGILVCKEGVFLSVYGAISLVVVFTNAALLVAASILASAWWVALPKVSLILALSLV